MLLDFSKEEFTQVNILNFNDLNAFFVCLFHPRWENAENIQESLKNKPANLGSFMEKHSAGVEEENRNFPGKCLPFQREVRISTTNCFCTALFLY